MSHIICFIFALFISLTLQAQPQSPAMYFPVTEPNGEVHFVAPTDPTQELLVMLKNFQLFDTSLDNEKINESLYAELVEAIYALSTDELSAIHDTICELHKSNAHMLSHTQACQNFIQRLPESIQNKIIDIRTNLKESGQEHHLNNKDTDSVTVIIPETYAPVTTPVSPTFSFDSELTSIYGAERNPERLVKSIISIFCISLVAWEAASIAVAINCPEYRDIAIYFAVLPFAVLCIAASSTQ